MEKIESGFALDALKRRYARTGICNNLYMLNGVVGGHLCCPAIYYEESASGMILLIDAHSHYKLVFSLLDADTCQIFNMDKDICCDYISIPSRNNGADVCRSWLVGRNGFQEDKISMQMRFCCGEAHTSAISSVEKDAEYLSWMGMTIRPAQIGDREEIERLTATFISKYDTICFEPYEWVTQLQKGDALCVYCGNEMAAFYVFTSEGGRIAVKPRYRGLGLSRILRLSFAAQPRWENSSSNQYDWVNPDNQASMRGLRQIGALETGKIKYRFVRRKEASQK